MEIIKKKEMPLLSRTRVTAMHKEKGATPSRKELRKQMAKQLKEAEEKVVIKHVYSQFGKNDTKVIAHVYKDKDEMEKFENPSLIKKHQEKKEEKPKAEPAQPAEAKPEEGKAEKAKPEEKAEQPAKEEAPKEESKEAPKEETKEKPKEG